jgi:hypothetical protein
VLAGNLKEGGHLKNLDVNGKNIEVCYINRMEDDGIFWTRIGKKKPVVSCNRITETAAT